MTNETEKDSVTGAIPIMFGDGVLSPPYTDSMGELRDVVTHTMVDMKHTVQWKDRVLRDGFTHTHEVGEDFVFDYPLEIVFKDSNDWDGRTPILHPAVAGLDTTAAGFDEAYIRALANMEILVMGRREEYSAHIRSMARRCVKKQFHPFRLLVRGAAMWTALSMKERVLPDASVWAATGRRPTPLAVVSLTAYASLCRDQALEPRDVLFINCEDSLELYMVDVMQALASDTFPFQTN
jgi:hypothetical protein